MEDCRSALVAGVIVDAWYALYAAQVSGDTVWWSGSSSIRVKLRGDTARRRGGTAGGAEFRRGSRRRWLEGATARLNIVFADDVAGHLGGVQCLPSVNDNSCYEGTPTIIHRQQRSSSGGATVHPT